MNGDDDVHDGDRYDNDNSDNNNKAIQVFLLAPCLQKPTTF
jgi:hypothetical protein